MGETSRTTMLPSVASRPSRRVPVSRLHSPWHPCRDGNAAGYRLPRTLLPSCVLPSLGIPTQATPRPPSPDRLTPVRRRGKGGRPRGDLTRLPLKARTVPRFQDPALQADCGPGGCPKRCPPPSRLRTRPPWRLGQKHTQRSCRPPILPLLQRRSRLGPRSGDRRSAPCLLLPLGRAAVPVHRRRPGRRRPSCPNGERSHRRLPRD